MIVQNVAKPPNFISHGDETWELFDILADISYCFDFLHEYLNFQHRDNICIYTLCAEKVSISASKDPENKKNARALVLSP